MSSAGSGLIIQDSHQHLPGLRTVPSLYRFDSSSFHAEIFRSDCVFNHLSVPEFADPGHASDGYFVQPALRGAAVHHHHMLTTQTLQTRASIPTSSG